MNPISKAKVVLKSLAEAPATASELSADLGMSRSFIGPTLIHLHQKGYVTRSIFTRGGHGPAPFMYQISDAGLREAKS